MEPTERLKAAGIHYVREKDRITIRHAGKVIEYWMCRGGEWVERGSGRRRLGMRSLLAHIGARP